jgi:RecB family endonuclease NucS
VRERENLQRVIRRRLEVIAPGAMLLAEEFGELGDSRRRIDLLALDQDANLVVIELTRTESRADMKLQALRYARWFSR